MNTCACALFVVSLAAGSVSHALGAGGKSPSPIELYPDTGSDAWGYTWFRSDEPGGPPYRWVEITTRGTLVTGLGDDFHRERLRCNIADFHIGIRTLSGVNTIVFMATGVAVTSRLARTCPGEPDEPSK